MVYDREKILDWYEKEGGKGTVENYIPSQANFIEKYYLLDSNEVLENTGIYRIDFNDIPIYVGQSGNLAYRMLTHIYNIMNGITEWGINPSEVLERKVQINTSIVEKDISDQNIREKKEIDFIHQFKPLLQCKNEKHYPKDKSMKNNGRWVKREDIPIDLCIREKIRKEVVRERLGI